MFRNRKDAGEQLARKLLHYKGESNTLVLALPRGGVVTGYEIARIIRAPLDVLIVRKLGVPWNPELAAGAVSETGALVENREILKTAGLTRDFIRTEASRQKEEITRRAGLYRPGKKIAKLDGQTVILVDDGVATGATMKAAIATLKKENIDRLVVALPVAPPETALKLGNMVDEFICLLLPDDFASVGQYYDDFGQVSDEEVAEILQLSAGVYKE